MRKHALYLFLISCMFFFSGCFHAKEYIYFQNLHAKTDTSKAQLNDSTTSPINAIVIQPFDQLDIRIKASEKALETLTESGSSGSTISNGGVLPNALSNSSYLTGFQVDLDGNVTLPKLGRIRVKGLTILQAKIKIGDLMKEYIKDPYVDIKFLTFRVTVLGEVLHPGMLVIPNEKANLIDALAGSYDLTDAANRKKIKIIRGDPRNPTVYELDMTDTRTFNSPGFILQPNDIIYVEPLARKFFFANLSEAVPFFSIISTILAVVELFLIVKNNS